MWILVSAARPWNQSPVDPVGVTVQVQPPLNL